jgi:hypothetical protein
MGGTFMFARAGGRNFAWRLPAAAVGEPASAALCASVLALSRSSARSVLARASHLHLPMDASSIRGMPFIH